MSPGNQIIVSDLPSELKNEPVNLMRGADEWQENLARDLARKLLDGKPDLHSFFINQVEKIIIGKTLEHTKYRKLDAANFLGIGRNTVTRKIKELKIVRS
jgi:two-component system nitrogen regulation response regulator GlnG